MAGIGFELKKLYKNRGLILDFRAFLYVAIVTIGPQIIFLIMIGILQLMLYFLNVSFTDREFFIVSVVYPFTFSQIITSGFSMLITRYISDRLYSREYDKILPSLYGVLSLCLTIGGVIGIIFLYRAPINIYFKLTTFILYIELIIMWLQSVYLSALKDYIKIIKSYAIGVIVVIALSFILVICTKLMTILSILIALDIGILIIITLLMAHIQSFFESSSSRYFDFLVYFDKYYLLFFTSFFYTLGLYIHNLIFWNSDLIRVVAKTYIYAPKYDIATFYALLTILPASIIFVVSVETSFYDRYKQYYSYIIDGGNLKEIIRARKSMITVLWQEMLKLMQIQLFLTLIFIVLGNRLLQYIGLTQDSIDIFSILSLGAYCTIFLFFIILIELYFDNRKGAFSVSAIFLILNTVFTIISIVLGLIIMD